MPGSELIATWVIFDSSRLIDDFSKFEGSDQSEIHCIFGLKWRLPTLLANKML